MSVLLLGALIAFGGAQTEPEATLPTNAALPSFTKPSLPNLPTGAPSLRSKDLEIVVSPSTLGAMAVRVAGRPFAIGQDHPIFGYVTNGELRWFDLANATDAKFNAQGSSNSIRTAFSCSDPDRGRWQINQQFSLAAVPGAFDVTVEVTVDQSRSVAFLSMFVIFPGAGGSGPTKGQGLLAGLEYLENEPSSSEADVIGPASKRQVADTLKLTFPLMAIQNDGRYLALTWQMRPHLSAVFDSPDRLFGSGGHVLGLVFPGSNGKNRQEGSLLPRVTDSLHPGESLVLRCTLLGGTGQSIVPAVEQYIALRGLPELPGADIELQQYVANAAGGWLDSKLREGNLFRHAIAGGNFAPGRAADAAVWMDWLAAETSQTDLSGRLVEMSKKALTDIAPRDLNHSGVGHVRYPVASLIYGNVAETAAQAARSGQGLLGRFETDGSVKYRPNPGGLDYARTHYTNEANGFTSRVVQDLLEAAAFSGDTNLIQAGLRELRAMDKFSHGVPRGAQTWECPLHTPDILASAQMVRAYTLGYELTGSPEFLEQARYWAWTGVPFVYLVNPTDQPVGLYSTIAVFGATQWKAPVWLGLPVQWCGLVYADALYRLVRHDPTGPWKKLADGITLSGIQQSWPISDAEKQGLLPDSFVLRSQHRNGPAINPATLQACATRYFSSTPVYDFCALRRSGMRVHAPGAISSVEDNAGHVSFQVASWRKGPYYVLINGVMRKPALKVNDQPSDCSDPHQFLEKEGWLILRLENPARIALDL